MANSATGCSAGGGGIVSVNKTDTFSMASTTFADLTGLSASITPSATSSKILVIVNLNNGGNTQSQTFARILRDAVVILEGDAGGNRTQASIGMTVITPSSDNTMSSGITYLDSPSSTSALTYKVQVAAETGTTITINKSVNDADTSTINRSVSSLTLIEVLA